MRAIGVLLLTVCAVAMAGDLDFSRLGVYAADFEFCTLSVVKVPYAGDAATAERLTGLRSRLKASRAAGRTVLLGLYTFDRVKHAHPLAEYIANTDAVLAAVDIEDVHAVFLNEENVTWNNGLAVLNGIYDHVKGVFPRLPVFQWLSAPDGPHPDLKADGWVYDYYGQDRAATRRKVMEYVVTGKPLVFCLNASPDVARFDAPGGGRISQEQFEVCREFNLPVFAYCVDLRYGNPFIWWHSAAPEIAPWRTWLLGVVDTVRQTAGVRLPLAAADYSDADPVEAAPDAEGWFRWEESFERVDFLRRCSARGFRNLRWDAGGRRLLLEPVSAAFRQTELFVRVVSDFVMSAPEASLEVGSTASPGGVRLQLSATGHNWPHSAFCRQDASLLAVSAAGDPAFAGREFWVRVSADVGEAAATALALDSLRFACRVTPPAQPGLCLEPDRQGQLCFEDRFASAKYRWLAVIENGDAIAWMPGQLAISGVAGRGNRVVLRWPVTCARPMSDLAVTLDGRANGPNLGATTTLGASLDGLALLATVSTRDRPADRNGWQHGPLELDLGSDARFAGVQAFWVHIELVNGSGVKTNPSNQVTRLAIHGRAEPSRP